MPDRNPTIVESKLCLSNPRTLQQVVNSDLDRVHPGLVGHVLRGDGLPAGSGRAHAHPSALGVILPHLRMRNK